MTTGLDAAVVREETKMKQENGRTVSFDGGRISETTRATARKKEKVEEKEEKNLISNKLETRTIERRNLKNWPFDDGKRSEGESVLDFAFAAGWLWYGPNRFAPVDGMVRHQIFIGLRIDLQIQGSVRVFTSAPVP